MGNPTIDIAEFCEKHHRMPETDRDALWTFSIEGKAISFWGSLAAASSTASLYARLHDMEDTAISLVDYVPLPKFLRHTV